ncbi:MAG: hypothetical protein AABX05_03405, partial [Nanoarchaeota archaeon]
TVENLNFIEPSVADVSVYYSNFNVIGGVIIEAGLCENISLYFNVTSRSRPEVKLIFDGQELSASEVSSGNNFVLLNAQLAGTENKPYRLSVEAAVGGKKTVVDYILAVEGFIYKLDQAGYPKINLIKKDDKYKTSYVLQNTAGLQPLSLLCGELDLTYYKDDIDRVLSYQNEVEQWKEGLPSEFFKLEADAGYLLKLKGDNLLNFTVECDEKPSSGLSGLASGWHLVGISSYKPVSTKDIVLPNGKDIVDIYEFNQEQRLNLTKLDAGLVYWLHVG